MFKKLTQILNTLRYLKPSQLGFFIWRRQGGFRRVNHVITQPVARTLQLAPPIATSDVYLGAGSFRFLNVASNPVAAIDWTAKDKLRLWGYNLHYFDYLRQSDISLEEKNQLIQSWIKSNPQQCQPGWEPFTASLRIVNWIYFLAQNKLAADASIINSLYLQCLWLEKNDERHILANHYFENLKALLFAGIYFEGDDAARWLKRATHQLQFQIAEQTLADGGHYERSPQYHCLMLENYLDIYNLVTKNSDYFSVEFTGQIKQAVQSGLAFINAIVFPDGKIPLLNDSAWGVAPSLHQLNSYASHLLSYQPASSEMVTLIDKPDSGLYGVKTSTDMLIMDCGEIGPSYQPGHTHCDFLSYELMHAKRRMVVDTGVCEYQPGKRRHYLRSTAAHNTVSIDGLEQSEIWGEFRVARRAQKIEAAAYKGAQNIEISGAYLGFYRDSALGGPQFRHERQINVKLVKESFDSIGVVDTLNANQKRQKGQHCRALSYIHLHPDVDVKILADNCFDLLIEGESVATLSVDADAKATLAASIYCPEFGVTENNTCIEIEMQGILPLQFGYRLKFANQPIG